MCVTMYILYVNIDICMYACLYTDKYVYMYMYLYMNTCIYMYICICVYMYICTHVYIYTCTSKYIRIYAYAHNFSSVLCEILPLINLCKS